MAQAYIERTLETVLKKAATEFPAIVLTGPRQSGKTTLLKHLFGETHRYVSLEPPDIRAAAQTDPRGFLDMNPAPVVFDEVQYAPELLAYIKERIDSNRNSYGQYLLTGSQNLLLTEQITESLAGRAAMLRLLPLSQREKDGQSQKLMPWETTDQIARSKADVQVNKLWETFLRGGFPELAISPKRDANLWHASYIQTYLERDVRSLRNVGDLSQFQSFLRALAARSAQLLVLNDLARDLGIAVNTIKAWLSVLEATYQIVILRPYSTNIGKRLVKTPKVYFTDVGTLCYLTGLRDATHAASGPMGGPIFETAVLSEIVKTLTHRGMDPQLYFWRTSTGTEVDIIVESNGRLVPVEVKLSATPKSAMAAGIKAFTQDYGDKVMPGYVVHTGNHTLPLGDDVTALPFREL